MHSLNSTYLRKVVNKSYLFVVTLLLLLASKKSFSMFFLNFNKGYSYPMICALVKFNFRYEFESMHNNRHLEVKTTV